jgi:hypothetical protein
MKHSIPGMILEPKQEEGMSLMEITSVFRKDTNGKTPNSNNQTSDAEAGNTVDKQCKTDSLPYLSKPTWKDRQGSRAPRTEFKAELRAPHRKRRQQRRREYRKEARKAAEGEAAVAERATARGEAAREDGNSQWSNSQSDEFQRDESQSDESQRDESHLDTSELDTLEAELIRIDSSVAMDEEVLTHDNINTHEMCDCRKTEAQKSRDALLRSALPAMFSVKRERIASPTFEATPGFKRRYSEPRGRTLLNPKTAKQYETYGNEGWKMVLENDPSLAAPPRARMDFNSKRWNTRSTERKSVEVEGKMLKAYDAIRASWKGGDAAFRSMLKRGGKPEAWEGVTSGPRQPWYPTTIHSMRRSVRGMGKQVHDLLITAVQEKLDEHYGKGVYVAMPHPEDRDHYDPALGSHVIFTCLEKGEMTTMHHDAILGLSVVGSVALEDGAPQLPTFFHECEIDLHAEAESMLRAIIDGDEFFNEAVVSSLRRLDAAYDEATKAREDAPDVTADEQKDTLNWFTPKDHLHGGRTVVRLQGKKPWRLVLFVDVLETWAVEARERSLLGGSLFTSEIVYDRFTIRESELWMALLGQMAEVKGIMLDRERMGRVLAKILCSSRACFKCNLSTDEDNVVCTNSEEQGCPNAVHVGCIEHGPPPSISRGGGQPWFCPTCVDAEVFFPPADSQLMPVHTDHRKWKCPSKVFKTLVELLDRKSSVAPEVLVTWAYASTRGQMVPTLLHMKAMEAFVRHARTAEIVNRMITEKGVRTSERMRRRASKLGAGDQAGGALGLDTQHVPQGWEWNDAIDLTHGLEARERKIGPEGDEGPAPDLMGSDSDSEDESDDADDVQEQPGQPDVREPTSGRRETGASGTERVTKPKFPAKYLKIADMDAKVIEVLKEDLLSTTDEWVEHGDGATMVGIPWHTLPGTESLRSIWNGQEVSRVKASPAWFALREAILKKNPWMHKWNDPLGSINLMKVLEAHTSQEHLDGPDGHLTLVFRLQGRAAVSVWANRRKPNQLSTARKVPSKKYRLLPLRENQAYAIDACRVAHFGGYSEGEILAIWRLGLCVKAFKKGQEREALASPDQLNAEASVKWEGIEALVMPNFEEFMAELKAQSEECEDEKTSGLEGDRSPRTIMEDEEVAPAELAGGATMEESWLDGRARDIVEFAVNEAAPHTEEVEPGIVVSEVHDREGGEAKGPAANAPEAPKDAAANAPEAPATVDTEAEVGDPRGPEEANPVMYDRTWSTKFESKCPDGYTLFSQGEGSPVVYKTKHNGNRNSNFHLEFEPCKLPVGHRDRVRVKYHTRSLGATKMSFVHRDRPGRESFATVDLKAYTRWMSSRGKQFVPKFCQGCCHGRWHARSEVESNQVE